jgi:hypothetical protein
MTTRAKNLSSTRLQPNLRSPGRGEDRFGCSP